MQQDKGRTRKDEEKEAVTLCAVGVLSPNRGDPETGLALAAPLLREADIAFSYLQRMLSDRGEPAYTWGLISNSTNYVKALTNAGFNVISTCGSHHMDASYACFIDTINNLKQNNILPVGVGMNLAEAHTPAIIERKGVRVAFLGYSSILPKAEISYEAQVKKPGCAPMFISTYYEATDWQPGMAPEVITIANKGDVAAMVEDIRKAKAQADVVIISMHWGIHWVPAVIPMYAYEVGHAAIDAGADLILGHHAHILKGVEVYKGKVIFHSLGNFCEDKRPKSVVDVVRWESFSKYDSRFKPGWNKDAEIPDVRKTMIAKCIISGKKITRVSFLPCINNEADQAEPLSCKDKRSDEVYQYVEWICKEVGMDTRFSREGDEVVVMT